MKLSVVGSNAPRHGEAAGFRVPKDFSGKKRGTALILLRRAGEGGKEEGECTKKDIRTDHARRQPVGFRRHRKNIQ